MDLNDDCLLEIMKYLKIMDLVNISKMCVKLRDLAHDSFDLKYKDIDFDRIYEY